MIARASSQRFDQGSTHLPLSAGFKLKTLLLIAPLTNVTQSSLIAMRLALVIAQSTEMPTPGNNGKRNADRRKRAARLTVHVDAS